MIFFVLALTNILSLLLSPMKNIEAKTLISEINESKNKRNMLCGNMFFNKNGMMKAVTETKSNFNMTFRIKSFIERPISFRIIKSLAASAIIDIRMLT